MVMQFLEENRNQWYDMNIPEEDGRAMYDLIIENGYARALEIGTSTGRSAVWIAWALSRTGGKLITIEIDEGRYKKALKNFRKAGLDGYIDARLADAHQLVPELEGPFDFVFCDADKEGYTQYLKTVLPRLEKGGCFVAHNVLDLRYARGIKDFLEFLEKSDQLETAIDRSSGSGLSVSYRK